MEDRNGLVVDTRLSRATGTAERDAALDMAARIPGGTKRVTLGGDKNYDTRDFVSKLREAAVTPHLAQNQHARRTSAIDERTTRHPMPRLVFPQPASTTNQSDITFLYVGRLYVPLGFSLASPVRAGAQHRPTAIPPAFRRLSRSSSWQE
jgi:hypothetical protein